MVARGQHPNNISGRLNDNEIQIKCESQYCEGRSLARGPSRSPVLMSRLGAAILLSIDVERNVGLWRAEAARDEMTDVPIGSLLL